MCHRGTMGYLTYFFLFLSYVMKMYLHLAKNASFAALLVLCLMACAQKKHGEVDRLNEIAYDFHYRNLDSTWAFALKAKQLAGNYNTGRAEALNNMAFVHIAKMEYQKAYELLDSVERTTDNQVELLIADIQLMRLCQRESKNMDFYTYKERASQREIRVNELNDELTPHLRKRLVYARSEFSIVASTYYYYVGLEKPSIEALMDIDEYGDIQQDTAQWLNYLYNVGAGGIIVDGSTAEIAQKEFDYLMLCYDMALRHDYPFWLANSMQAISEHLQDAEGRNIILANYPAQWNRLNVDRMPDSLLAGNLAQHSLEIFREYGDVYQTAGAYRTLASCFWYIKDYVSAQICLQKALEENPGINQAPDLVASIWEQLSMLYSALNDKQNSDINRNLYLDKQELTRQDRYLESRAAQLNKSVSQLNVMMAAVVLMIVMLLLFLVALLYLRKKKDRKEPINVLLAPLQEWKENNEQYLREQNEQFEEIIEQDEIVSLRIADNKRKYLEQRAKVSLVNSITPFIDRMILEINKLRAEKEKGEVRENRFTYVAELADKINECNNTLTNWIQMRQGDINLRIESFPLQDLFDIVAKGKMGFSMKGIDLEIVPSLERVKADRILTLFMINTIADNARKFTPKGGKVKVWAQAADNYVEISVEDNGCGMNDEQLDSLFSVDKRVGRDDTEEHLHPQNGTLVEKGHGFGLVNCKGIIEKYRKMSAVFNVCSIQAESTPGKGSRFFFRLPKGMAKCIIWACMAATAMDAMALEQGGPDIDDSPSLVAAGAYADSTYNANLRGQYKRALDYADSTILWLNAFYKEKHPTGVDTMVAHPGLSNALAELTWVRDSLKTDYDVILSVRNESAVAALALHEWALYRYNNKIYTQLFKELSADNTLDDYCKTMQRSKENKTMAIVILLILFASLVIAYILLYYRHRVFYRFCVDRVNAINKVLLSNQPDEEKLRVIRQLTDGNAKGTSLFKTRQILPYNLANVVEQVVKALENSVEVEKRRSNDIELAGDELHRLQLENEKYHISNSVLDNCLSTLKHETMYYPSRIRLLVDGKDENINSIAELAHYYKELYSLLSQQAMRQLETVKMECKNLSLAEVFGISGGNDTHVMGDAATLEFMAEILRKQNKGVPPGYAVTDRNGRYVTIEATLPNLVMEKGRDLFSPDTENIPFLLCRQIVRDIGECTNARGCGIATVSKGAEGTILGITLAKGK